MAEHKARNVVGHEAVIGFETLLMGERVEIGALDVADDLQALGVKIVVKTGQLHGRTVEVGRGQNGLFVILGSVQNTKLVLLHDGLEFDSVFAFHPRILLLIKCYTLPLL